LRKQLEGFNPQPSGNSNTGRCQPGRFPFYILLDENRALDIGKNFNVMILKECSKHQTYLYFCIIISKVWKYQ